MNGPSVKFTLGGHWRMLLWHEQNQGQHIILAKSHQGVIATFRTVLARYFRAEARGYWGVEVLAPSLAMNDAARYLDEKELKGDFWHYIENRAASFARDGQELPPGLSKCNNLKQNPEYGQREDGREDEDHDFCLNCTMGVVFDGDRDTFYQKRRSFFHKSIWQKRERRYSRAVQSEDEKLMVALMDFGHHQKGVCLSELEMPEKDAEYRSQGFAGDALFFYKVVDHLALEEFGVMGEGLRAAMLRKREAESLVWQQEQDRRRLVEDAVFLRLMNGEDAVFLRLMNGEE